MFVITRVIAHPAGPRAPSPKGEWHLSSGPGIQGLKGFQVFVTLVIVYVNLNVSRVSGFYIMSHSTDNYNQYIYIYCSISTVVVSCYSNISHSFSISLAYVDWLHSQPGGKSLFNSSSREGSVIGGWAFWSVASTIRCWVGGWLWMYGFDKKWFKTWSKEF